MKITLIRPNIARMEPLALGVLAALTPPDVEVVRYDERLEPIPYDESTDLAAISHFISGLYKMCFPPCCVYEFI